VYFAKEYKLPISLFGFDTLTCSPAVIYAICYVFFAAIIAPFAGFFASGLKRAYKIKDFSDTLPGHGGLTDRMDCISLTGMFSMVLISTVIFRNEVSAEKAYRQILQLGQSE